MASGIVTHDYLLGSQAISPVLAPCVLAGTIVADVRRRIPDPTFTMTGGVRVQDPIVNPDHDGFLIEAVEMYTWLSDGMKELTRLTNWMLDDWWAFAAQTQRGIYDLDSRWHQVSSAYAYQFRCWPVPEEWTLTPSQAVQQPMAYGWHRRIEVATVYYYPNPHLNDPSTLLTAPISPIGDVLSVQSTTGFQTYGYCLVDGELIYYAKMDPVALTLSILLRGVGGTTAASHDVNAGVQSRALVVKGKRIPTDVAGSQDCVEIPRAFQTPLKTYMRAQAKGLEQDDVGEDRLMRRFEKEVEAIKRDPIWQAELRDGAQQVPAYGTGVGGPYVYPDGAFGYLLR